MNSRFDHCRSRSACVRVLARTLCVAALATPLAAWAASQTLTLPEAVRLASERAPMLEARRAGVSAAQQEAARAGALPDPMLTLGIDNLPVTGRDAFDTRVDDMTMKKIGVRQEIPSRAKRSARRSFAARQFDEAQAQAEAEGLAVRRAAAEAWIGVWAAQRELLALQKLREQAALAANVSKARVAGGGEAVSDALATQAALLELDNRIEAAREAEYQAALATREDLRRQEAAGIRADLARWDGLKRQVVLHEDALLPLAQDRSATTLAAYRAGGDLQPWLDARRDELDVHLAHAEHLGELGRAWAALAFLLPTEAQP